VFPRSLNIVTIVHVYSLCEHKKIVGKDYNKGRKYNCAVNATIIVIDEANASPN